MGTNLAIGIVLLALTLIAAVHHQCKRDRALEVILEGHERLAIDAVQKQRRRLLSPRTRRGLARTLEEIIEQAAVRRRRNCGRCRRCSIPESSPAWRIGPPGGGATIAQR